jgi:hypothetical protein
MKKKYGGKFRPLDFLFLALCFSGVVCIVILVVSDLLKILDFRNEKPVGTVIQSNNAQWFTSKRGSWERLSVDSSIYSGDQIRTADISNVTLYIDHNTIDLNERTLIRLQRSPEDEDAVLIYLDEGNLVLTTVSGGGNIVLNLMGHQVEAVPGTALSASAGKDGAVVRVSEGAATLTKENGEKREIASGRMLALDAGGVEQPVKAAVVLQPRPEARYLKDGSEPLFVNFAWNRINLAPGEALCLELAEDRNFNRIVRVVENLDASAGVAFNSGLWYWRLSLMPDASNTEGAILAIGRLTVANASGPALLSPVTGSLFRYQDKLPGISFRWAEIAGALSYILEVSQTPDFINPMLRTQTASVFLVDSNSSLGPGTWYWRVMPVFPPVYEGRASFSPASLFRIEQGGGDLGMVLPAPVLPVPVLPERATEQPAPLPPPLNRQPSTGYRIGIEQLKESDSIVFSWSAVQGANAYIFTLFEQTASGRRLIISRPPESRRSWTLENLATLGRGTFVWQVEAVRVSSTGTIERRGSIVENSFVIDIPRSGLVEVEVPGIQHE